MAAASAEWKKKGNAKYNDGQYLDAIECYSKAITLNPSDKFLYGNRGQAYCKLGKFDLAIADSLKSTELDPNFSKGFYRTGNAYLKIGKLAEAAEQFQLSAQAGEVAATSMAQEISQLQEDWQVGRDLAEAKPAECVQRLRKLVKLATHCMEMKKVFVMACAKTDHWDEVVGALKEVVDDDQFLGDIELRYLLAVAYYNLACFDDCLRSCDGVTALEASYKDVPALRGKCAELQKLVHTAKVYMQKNEYQWSYETFTKAMGVDTSVPVIQKYLRACRAVPLMNLGRYQEAITDCTKALEGNTAEWRVKALECRGYCYEAQGEIQLAIGDYERALDISPNRETEQRLHNLKTMKPKRKNYYQILGVAKDADANTIKSAYRKLALQYHPDRQKDASEEEMRIMKIKFQEIAEACSVLSDPEKRARYDAGENLETIDLPEHDPFIIFNMVCGTLPEDATVCQTVVHKCKQCAFWSGCCVLATITCPCWCPILCLRSAERDRNQNQAK
eukprot:TRINITY_DN80769_c0_g1_i1.p1 TRINITY_DN80769_c0_g1~~TRINITY_DN80769_c0_g1_i1.p1  ORF type:complete len:504 (-),score=95.10 TRINITY_DN80769_c0_g1_i1:138-1649(-)